MLKFPTHPAGPVTLSHTSATAMLSVTSAETLTERKTSWGSGIAVAAAIAGGAVSWMRKLPPEVFQFPDVSEAHRVKVCRPRSA